MPTAIPFAAAYLASNAAAAIGASVATQATIAATTAAVAATLQTVAVTAVASYAASRILAPGRPGPSFGQQEIKQPAPPLRVILGRLKVGVALNFAATSGEDSPNRYTYARIGLLAGHEIDEIEAHYLYGAPMDVDPTTHEVQNSFGPLGSTYYVQIYSHLGDPAQTADTAMQTIFPGIWTSAHRGRGLAYTVLLCFNPGSGEDVQKVFPQGPPEYQALVRGKKVYDPRKDSTNGGSGSHRMNDESTWEWTEEQRLLKLWYLVDRLGYGKGFDRIDWTTWVPQIARGAEAVPLKSGGTEQRYRMALSYEPATEQKTDVFNRICAAGDSRIFFTSEGKIGCRGGAWDAPTVSLSVKDAGIEAEFGRPDRMDAYNVLPFKFLSPPHDFIEQPGDPWRDEDRITAEGERPHPQGIDLTHVPTHSQARRLCKQFMARDNPAWQGSARTKLHGIAAIGEESINLTLDEFDDGTGDFNGPFFLEGEITVDLETETIMLPLKSADPASYSWDANTEEGTPPRIPGPSTPEPASLLDDLGNSLLDDTGDSVVMSEAA